MNFRALSIACGFTVALAVPSLTTPAFADSNERVRPKGGYVVVPPPDPDSPAAKADISKVIFVNRCVGGCNVSPGGNDARTNTSSIPSQASTISEFQWGNDVYNEVVECLREVYRPFDVEIVTEDPGMDMFHHEAILAGFPQEIGQNEFVGGIAPLAGNCAAINNVISFSFANSLGPNVNELCWTVAQESAHAFGLDHELDCHDPMTYIPGCGRKFFRDEAFDCGEDQVRQCFCGGNKQNSHRKLVSVFGEGVGAEAPTVEVLLPADGVTVEDGFAIFGSATDPRQMLYGHVDLYLNGSKWDEKPGDQTSGQNQYQFDAPGNLPDGVIDVEIRACNGLEVCSSATITVTKGAPCTSADTCLAGQMCEEGKCFWLPPTGELGDECLIERDCISNLCPSVSGESYCSEFCFAGIADQCSDGYDCLAIPNDPNGQGICWPAEGGDGGGGCCSVNSDREAPVTELVLFGLVVMFAVRRRRRRA